MNAPLAVIVRSGFAESAHSGSAIVITPDGETALSLGDPDATILPRSSMKPFQAIGLLATGLELDDEQLVLASSSHAGTPRHVAVVRRILDAAGLDESALGCPADWPLDSASRNAHVRAGGSAERILMNCSGKHAAMLAASVHNLWTTSGYLDPEHPVQRKIHETVERFTGEKVSATAVDGCGAPVYAMSLSGLARGIQRIGTSNAASPFALFRHAARLRESALANGWAIEGDGRPNTVVIDELGVFAKGGAEGVLVMTTRSGATVALKVADGSARAATLIALDLLASTGVVERREVDRVLPLLGLTLSGGDTVVGGIHSVATGQRYPTAY